MPCESHLLIRRDQKSTLQMCLPSGEVVNPSGAFYVSTDQVMAKYENSTRQFGVSGGYMNINKDEQLWVGIDGGSVGTVRKYDSDGNVLVEGTTPNSWDNVFMYVPVYLPGGGVACAYRVTSGSNSTFKVSGWDSDGNVLWTQHPDNSPGASDLLYSENMTADRDGFVYVTFEDNRNVGTNGHGFIQKIRHSDGVIVDEVDLGSGFEFDLAHGFSMNADNDAIFVTAKSSVSGTVTLFKINAVGFSVLSSVNIGGAQGVPTEVTAMGIDQQDNVYVGVDNDVLKIPPDLSSQSVFVSLGVQVMSISVDTQNNVYVLGLYSDGFGGNEGRAKKYNSAGSIQFTVDEPGLAKSIVVHPGAISIL